MKHPRPRRTTREKLQIFRSCFTGRTDVYGTYDPRTGRVRQVKQPVTDQVLLAHLKGEQPYGVYLLAGDRTRAIAADFDDEDTWRVLEFVRQAAHYEIAAYVERSKSKGWHAWVFLELPSLPAVKARSVVKSILDDIGQPHTEVFPKQDRLTPSRSYGNFINAPLFGLLVPRGRTVFVDLDRGFRPWPNQWDLLADVQRVPESLLDELIEINALQPTGTDTHARRPQSETDYAARPLGLPPCAQRMLAEGVSEYQRVACFRLAVHLRKAGLPQDIAAAALTAWAGKNHPRDGKRVITDAEIAEQTGSAYARKYRGCGCEDAAVAAYCQPNCPLRTAVRTRPQPTQSHSGRFPAEYGSKPPQP